MVLKSIRHVRFTTFIVVFLLFGLFGAQGIYTVKAVFVPLSGEYFIGYCSSAIMGVYFDGNMPSEIDDTALIVFTLRRHPSGEILASVQAQEHRGQAGFITATFHFPTQPEGTMFHYQALVYQNETGPASSMGTSIDLPCIPDTVPATEPPSLPGIFDGRIDSSPGAPIITYPIQNGDGGYGLRVYGAQLNDNFYPLVLDVPASVIDGPVPEVNTELATSPIGPTTLYRLTTGEYQINSGPDINGNVYVLIMDDIPATSWYTRSFNIYDEP